MVEWSLILFIQFDREFHQLQNVEKCYYGELVITLTKGSRRIRNISSVYAWDFSMHNDQTATYIYTRTHNPHLQEIKYYLEYSVDFQCLKFS